MDDTPQIYLLLGRVEGKVDALLAKQQSSEERVSALESRIDNLELLRTRGSAAFSTIKFIWIAGAALAGVFAAQIKEILFR